MLKMYRAFIRNDRVAYKKCKICLNELFIKGNYENIV